MTLAELSAVSQLVGTLAVVASLVFVGVQIRQNTRATRAQVHQNITSDYLTMVQHITDNAKVFAQGIAATPESFRSFADEDKLVYFGVIFGFFKHFENMHSQYERRLIDDTSWAAWSEHALMYFNQPGVQFWWKLRKGAFHPVFRKFLETSPAPGTPNMVAVLHDKP